MDFWPTDEQLELAAGMRIFLDARYPSDHLQEVEESDAVIDRDRWRELAQMGVFALRSQGFGAREAMFVFEELGRRLVPGPLVASALADSLIPGADSGDRIVGLFEPSDDCILVEHPNQVDDLLWFDGDLLRLLDPASIGFELIGRPLDALSPAGRCTTSRDEIRANSTVLLDGAAVTQLRYFGIMLTAALQVGVSAAATDLANAYAKEREQFGRPIGGFQAVKHMLADMFVASDLARASLHAAGCALDGVGDSTPERAILGAKAVAGNAANLCGRTGIQIHGGMGYTWEVDAQRYWKRALVLDRSLGSSSSHSVTMGDLLIDGL